jgi:phosphoribosylanthranilate isomerase
VNRPHVKICGLKEARHVDAVLSRGGNEIGFVHFPPSPRHLEIADMMRLRAHAGGRALVTVVLVDPEDDVLTRIAERVRPDVLQLHGQESVARVAEIAALTGLNVMKAISVSQAADLDAFERYEPVAHRILIDAKRPKGSQLPGGNGVSFDWSLLDDLPTRDFTLSGGVTPANVMEAVRRVRPFALDLSSGVERAPGVKDEGLIHQLFDALDGADRTIHHTSQRPSA